MSDSTPGSSSDSSSAGSSGAALRVDIVSDVVCPWCIIGYKQLEQALARTGASAEIVWHPFELNPRMPAEGQNLREHIAEKYGASPASSAKARERLMSLGASLGFQFTYSDDSRIRNTFRAHQLLRWAQTRGRQHDLKMKLFEVYFTRGEDVHDLAVLTNAAAEVGLDADEARAVIEQAERADEVRREEEFWTSRGIRSVPSMVFNREYLVTGAQGVDNYTSIISQLLAAASGSPAPAT